MDTLKNIVILVPKGDIVLSSIVGTYKLLNFAINESGQDIKLTLAGCGVAPECFNGLFKIQPECHWKDVKQADLIIIPAFKSNLEGAIEENRELIEWLKTQYLQGTHLASLCTGSFFIAKAGLLVGKRCTTHWAFAPYFTSLFPGTHFEKTNIITEDQRLYTSGGAFSFLNMIVYLTERFFGKSIAMKQASIYEVDYSRRSQSQFMIFERQKAHNDEGIKKSQEYIESSYQSKITISQLAKMANLGDRTFSRRFKELTGNTPNEYLQRVRIEAAKELLATGDEPISQIQYRVGYNDPKTFRTIFNRYSGFTPNDYRKKYGFSLLHAS